MLAFVRDRSGGACLGEPISFRINFISGHAQCSSWSPIVIFEHSVPVRCCVHEQINTAYRTDIVQHDGSFCHENCRSWMDTEWNQFEIGEFSSDRAKALGCRSTPTVGSCARFGRWFRKLAEPGKAYGIVCRTELCYADRGAPILKCTNRNFEQILQILPCLEWNDACLFV